MSHVKFDGSVLDTKVEKIADVAPEGYSAKGFYGVYVGGAKVASCKDRYHVVSNRQVYDLAVRSADNFGISIDSLKSYNGGAKVSVQSEKSSFYIGDNEVNSRLSFINSHDGSTAVAAGLSSLTLVCSNQFYQALKGLSKFRHTDGVEKQMEFFLRAMEENHKEQIRLKEYFNRLANTKVKDEDFHRAINLCMNFEKRADPVNVTQTDWAENLSTQRYRKTVDVINIAEQTRKTHGGNNAWALLGVFTDVTSNYLSTPQAQALVGIQGHKLQTMGTKFVSKTTGLVLN